MYFTDVEILKKYIKCHLVFLLLSPTKILKFSFPLPSHRFFWKFFFLNTLYNTIARVSKTVCYENKKKKKFEFPKAIIIKLGYSVLSIAAALGGADEGRTNPEPTRHARTGTGSVSSSSGPHPDSPLWAYKGIPLNYTAYTIS